MECARSREAALRSDLAGWAEYGYCASHSRYFWGLRLHLLCTLHGLPVGFALTGAKADERQTLLGIFDADPALTAGRPAQIVIGDKNYFGREFETTLAEARLDLLRPARRDLAQRPHRPADQTLRPPSPRRAVGPPRRSAQRDGCADRGVALGPLRLADRSAWEQARYDRGARDRLHELREAKQLGICVISISELLYSARNPDELARLRLDLSPLPYLHLAAAAERQVEELRTSLAARGQYRTPIPDLMLAAIAHTNSAVVLHYDSDYERIAAVTGQAHEWIIPRSAGHGSDS